MLYDLGVTLSEENINEVSRPDRHLCASQYAALKMLMAFANNLLKRRLQAKEKLGMMAEGSSCDFGTFEAWWNGSHGAKKEHRNALLAGVPTLSCLYFFRQPAIQKILVTPRFKNHQA